MTYNTDKSMAKRVSQRDVDYLSNLPDPLVVCTAEGIILYENNEAKKFFLREGKDKKTPYTLFTLLEKMVFFNEHDKAYDTSEFIRNRILKRTKTAEVPVKYTIEYRPGTYWTLIRTIKTGKSARPNVMIIFTDQSAVKNKEERYKFLTLTTSTLATSLNYDERLQRLANLIIEHFADWCLIDTVTPEGLLDNHTIAYTKNQLAIRLEHITPTNANLLGFSQKIKRVYREGKPRVYHSVSRNFFDPAVVQSERFRLIYGLKLKTVALIPLIARNKILGVISFVRTGENTPPYSKEDMHFFSSLAAKAALLVDNSRLYSVLHRETVKNKEKTKLLLEDENAMNLLISSGKMGLFDWSIENGKIRSLGSLSKYPSLPFVNRQLSFSQFSDLIDPAYRTGWEKTITAAITKTGPFDFQFTVSAYGGRPIWIHAKGEVLPDGLGNPVRIIGVSIDETGRRIIEEKLIRNEQKFKRIFQSSLDPILMLDASLAITDANSAASALFTRSHRQIISVSLKDIFGSQDPDFLKKIQTAVLNSENARGEVTYTVHRDISKIFEYQINPYILPDGHMLMLHDNTDRIMEEKRSKHFIAIASHELKSPLASIKAMVSIIEAKFKKDISVDQHGYLTKINKKVDLLAQIINDLLDISRIRQGKLELQYEFVTIHEILAEVIEEAKLTSGQNIVQPKRIEGQMVIDRIRFAQVLRNIIRNAVKYAPRESTITITAQKNKNMMDISIADEGPGIPEEDSKKIFELYYQRKNSNPYIKDGLGVGLFLSAQIVKFHGGVLAYKKNNPRGAIFTISVPLKPKKIAREYQMPVG